MSGADPLTHACAQTLTNADNEPRAATIAKRPDNAQTQASIQEMTIRRNMETWIAHGRPTSFSQRRTDFASATPWFRGVQTGFWSTNAGDPRNTRDADAKEEKYCTGLYIAGCPPAGRYIDAETVISSINGPDNNLKLIADRERETRHSLRSRIPIGIAVSKDAAKPDEHGVQTFPCAIPEGLECVALGWYMITHMWVKPGKNAKGHDTDVWMARLEKIDLAERSWWSDVKWADQPQPSMEDRDFTTKAAKETCQTCQESSVRLFEPQFVCLNKQCRDWFLVNGEHADANPANLVYHHRFLMERFDRFDQSSHDAARGFWDFYPNLYPPPDQFFAKNYPDGQGPQVSVTPQNLAARNEALLTGFSCPQCGLTNSRVDYHRWHCRNTDCRDAEGNVKPFSYHAPPPRVTPEFLEAERKTVKEKAEKPFDKLFGYLGTEELGSHILYVFDFGGGCRMTILRPQVGSVAREMSDALFQRVQEDGAAGRLGLSRRTITANGGAGLTNHFVENFGERYYLPFALGDNPMAQAPEVVRDALDLANVYTWEYFGPGKNNEWRFNELYIAAYQSRKMHMNFHDDGEKKLGPIIGKSGQLAEPSSHHEHLKNEYLPRRPALVDRALKFTLFRGGALVADSPRRRNLDPRRTRDLQTVHQATVRLWPQSQRQRLDEAAGRRDNRPRPGRLHRGRLQEGAQGPVRARGDRRGAVDGPAPRAHGPAHGGS